MARRRGLGKVPAETAFAVFHLDSRRRQEHDAVCSSPVARGNQRHRFGRRIHREVDLGGNKPRQIARDRHDSRGVGHQFRHHMVYCCAVSIDGLLEHHIKPKGLRHLDHFIGCREHNDAFGNARPRQSLQDVETHRSREPGAC